MTNFDPNYSPRDYNRLMALARDSGVYDQVQPLLSSDHARAVADKLKNPDADTGSATVDADAGVFLSLVA